MIFSILKAVFFGRKCTGIVTGYEICKTYRSIDYYRYIVTANDKKYISAENLAVYDGRKPAKHLNCEVDVYCCDDSRVCTLYSLREMLMFLAVILLLLMLILIFGVLLK